jgi:hypothetical protein
MSNQPLQYLAHLRIHPIAIQNVLIRPHQNRGPTLQLQPHNPLIPPRASHKLKIFAKRSSINLQPISRRFQEIGSQLRKYIRPMCRKGRGENQCEGIEGAEIQSGELLVS